MLFRSAIQGHTLTSFRNAGNEISSVCMHLVNALDKGVILVITSELYIDMNIIDIEQPMHCIYVRPTNPSPQSNHAH